VELYFAAFAAALLVDTIPVFAPPAWTILAFIIVKWNPNPWAIIGAGAIGSVIGRYILTLYMPRLSARIFRRWENDNLSFWEKDSAGDSGRRTRLSCSMRFHHSRQRPFSPRPAWRK